MQYIVRVIVVDFGADRSKPTSQNSFFVDCCCYYANYYLFGKIYYNRLF